MRISLCNTPIAVFGRHPYIASISHSHPVSACAGCRRGFDT
ncbi:Uncharacterized protein PPKH_1338 [Pseudomonas putida]|nr:Uncharacterized protein PPKH_1338 [Pseudomonas putida]